MIRSIDRWVIGHAVELLEDLGASESGDVTGEVPVRLHVNISGRTTSRICRWTS